MRVLATRITDPVLKLPLPDGRGSVGPVWHGTSEPRPSGSGNLVFPGIELLFRLLIGNRINSFPRNFAAFVGPFPQISQFATRGTKRSERIVRMKDSGLVTDRTTNVWLVGHGSSPEECQR